MLLDRKTHAYRLRLTIDLIGEEMERDAAADRERMQGLLRMARADATALGGETFERADGGKTRANARPALRLVHGGLSD